MPDFAAHPERRRQIVRPDHDGIDAFDRDERLDVVDRVLALDLGDDERLPGFFFVCLEMLAEQIGSRKPDTTTTGGRPLAAGDDFAQRRGILDSRHHDSARAGVEGLLAGARVGMRHPHEG